jgi:nucleoside-diphosphate-sugar epimerase
MAHLFIFGLGYSAKRIADAARERGWSVSATGRAGEMDFADRDAVHTVLAKATHILSSVPPEEGGDPVLETYGDALGDGWLGYLSSTGVYGDAGGAWVDESAVVVGKGGGTGRRTVRSACDAQWLARGARVFRLPGIYGPGRSAIERVRESKAHMIDLPGQVFSRVHVEDIASAVIAALDAPPGPYNIADDLPAPQNELIEEASRLLGVRPPLLQSLDEAGLSPAARAFYAENRRVANGKAKRMLGWQPRYPTYREGLRGLLSGIGGGS